MKYFDTLENRLVEFVPRESGKVSIYVCGPTVYDVPHVGHARTALTYDMITRYWRWRGVEVTLVSNITDIDDKIISRANEDGKTEPEFAQMYADIYVEQMRALGIADPDHRPYATDYITEMHGVVKELLDRDHAYIIKGQGVYFDITSIESQYGQLVHRNAADLRDGAGARVDVDLLKRDALDFALWKAAKPGEPAWESPWGKGRPGWHIECVAMALDILGDGFDIHGGGSDLVFPHHENERIESEAAGRPFARGWIHSAMLNIDGEKMSKSLNNFRTLGDMLNAWGPRPIRLAMLQTHYRKVMELHSDTMDAATSALARLDAFTRRIKTLEMPQAALRDAEVEAFTQAMDHDFSTPKAVATIFDLVRAGHSAVDEEDLDAAASISKTVTELSSVLGLLSSQTDDTSGTLADDTDEIESLVAERERARSSRDFARADEMREALTAMNIEIEDTAAGPVWHRT